MTLEEAQAKILELQDDIKAKDVEIETVKAQNTELETTIQNNNSTISEKDTLIDTLRTSNNQLFLRTQQIPEQKKEEKKEEPIPSTADVINKLING